MENIIEFLKFSGGIFFVILIGVALISSIEKRLTASLLLISAVLGIVIISLVYLFLSYLKVPLFLINTILVSFALITINMFKPKLVLKIKDLILPLIFTIAGTILFNSKLFFEGFDKDRGFMLSKWNVDALWHIALQESLKISIPPVSPLYSGQILTGYHYLNDVFWVWFSKSLDLSTISLCIFWAPILISFLFVATTLLVMMKIFKDKQTAFLGSFLVIFTSSLSFIAPLFFHRAGFNQSVFWLDQPSNYIMNQQLTLSLAIINLISFFFISSLKKWWWIIGLLIGCLAGIKVYGLLIIFPCVLLIGFYLWYRKRDWNYPGMIMLSVFISMIVVLIEGPTSGFPFYINPGLLIWTMFNDPLRLNYPAWEIHRRILTEQHDWIRLTYQWGKGLAIFLIGNFNLKILALLFLPLLVKNKNLSRENKAALLLAVSVIVLSIIPALLLVQKGALWNVVQFLTYAQFPLVVIFVFCVKILLRYRYQVIVFIFILIMGVPSILYPLKFHSNTDSYIYYSPELMDVLQQTRLLPANSQIIVGNKYYKNSLVPAFIGRGVYLADINGLEVLLPFSAQERIEYVKELENRLVECQLNQYLISDKNNLVNKNQNSNNQYEFVIFYKRDKIYLAKCERIKR